jgi:hypothetical protein
MYHIILAYLLALPVCYQDRHVLPEVKAEQLSTVAAAISTLARDESEAALLVSVAWHESRLCLATHVGETSGRGRGLYQIERASRAPSAGKGYVGLTWSETLLATQAAVHVLRRSYQCGQGPRGRFTAYAGRPCHTSWPTLSERERTYYHVLSKLKPSKPSKKDLRS